MILIHVQSVLAIMLFTAKLRAMLSVYPSLFNSFGRMPISKIIMYIGKDNKAPSQVVMKQKKTGTETMPDRDSAKQQTVLLMNRHDNKKEMIE